MSDFNETWIFSADFLKILNLPNFKKILLVGTELFHSDGQIDRRTDMTKLIGRFPANVLRESNKKIPYSTLWRWWHYMDDETSMLLCK